MTSPTITLDSFGNLVDQCIADLRKGEGNRLIDLAAVFNSIAECNSEPYLFIFPQGIGAFSSELMSNKSITIVPVLPEEVRSTHKKIIDSAIEQATKALEEIKNQLCNGSTDHEKLMRSIGVFFQQASNLNSQRRQFARASQSGSQE